MKLCKTRNKAIAIAMAFVLIASSAMLLAACTSKSLAGTWKGQIVYTDSMGLKYDVPVTLVIDKDDKYKLTVEQNGRITGLTYSSGGYQGDCKVSGTVVKLYYDNKGNYMELKYDASTNGKQTLSSADGLELTKVS